MYASWHNSDLFACVVSFEGLQRSVHMAQQCTKKLLNAMLQLAAWQASDHRVTSNLCYVSLLWYATCLLANPIADWNTRRKAENMLLHGITVQDSEHCTTLAQKQAEPGEAVARQMIRRHQQCHDDADTRHTLLAPKGCKPSLSWLIPPYCRKHAPNDENHILHMQAAKQLWTWCNESRAFDRNQSSPHHLIARVDYHPAEKKCSMSTGRGIKLSYPQLPTMACAAAKVGCTAHL